MILERMPGGSLARYEEAARVAARTNNGLVNWQDIDGSWRNYEDAVRSVVNRIFHGSDAPNNVLRGFYDAIRAISEVN